MSKSWRTWNLDVHSDRHLTTYNIQLTRSLRSQWLTMLLILCCNLWSFFVHSYHILIKQSTEHNNIMRRPTITFKMLPHLLITINIKCKWFWYNKSNVLVLCGCCYCNTSICFHWSLFLYEMNIHIIILITPKIKRIKNHTTALKLEWWWMIIINNERMIHICFVSIFVITYKLACIVWAIAHRVQSIHLHSNRNLNAFLYNCLDNCPYFSTKQDLQKKNEFVCELIRKKTFKYTT